METSSASEVATGSGGCGSFDDSEDDPLQPLASSFSSAGGGVEFTVKYAQSSSNSNSNTDAALVSHHVDHSNSSEQNSNNQRDRCVYRSRSSGRSSFLSTHPEQIDPNERPRRWSVFRRESFVVQFAHTNGPPQICFLMMLVAIGLGSTIGVVPAVMTDRFARLQHSYQQPESCQSIAQTIKPAACLLGSADAQTAVATANLISNALTFVTSSLLGSLSDQYGRKNIIIVGLAVGSIPAFLLWLMQLIPTMSPWWYYGMHAASGSINWMAVAFSALADVLPRRFRAPGIGLLLAGFMLGFSLSPILALLLPSKPLSLVSFIVVLCGLVCTIVFVPETLPPSVAAEARRRRQRQQEQMRLEQMHYSKPHIIILQLVNIILRPFREMAILNRDTFFRLISSLAFFSGMVSSGDQVLLVYYLEERLGFTNRDISFMFLILGLMGLIAQGLLLKPLNDYLGEKNVVALAFLCGAIDNCMYGLAKNKQTIYVALGVAGLTGMAFPTISAIKANNVHESEQGRIQGALYSLQALASGLGPVSLKFVYAKTKNSALGPGSMFLFASCLYLVAVTIACSLPNEKANSRGTAHQDTARSGILIPPHDLEEYIQLASDSSSDEDYYGTMGTTENPPVAGAR